MIKITKSEINPSSMGHKTATVIIQADTLDEANGLEAKQLAYNQRNVLGLGDRSGVEALGGATPVKVERTAAELEKMSSEQIHSGMAGYAYEREFRLTEMI